MRDMWNSERIASGQQAGIIVISTSIPAGCGCTEYICLRFADHKSMWSWNLL